MSIVSNFSQLQNALLEREKEIIIDGSITCFHSFTLPEDAVLRGKEKEFSMLGFCCGDGVGLSANNTVKNLVIQTPQQSRAIYTTISHEDLGTFTLADLCVTGQVSLIFRSGTRKAKVIIEDLDIVSCDARHYGEQPQKYGVNVYQGALTVYNFNGDPNSDIDLTMNNIRIGRKNAPVLGSGIFVSGFGDNGGWVTLRRLTTRDVYSNGMIPFGCSDMITAAVFIVYGVKAEDVIHEGEVVTYGVNDMVLDAWGSVKNWECRRPILSYGPSGIGFVNFGQVERFIAHDQLITYGLGARGYNQYDGSAGTVVFHSITTFGDGSIGIQISKPVETLEIKNDIHTLGSIGDTLVKGVVVRLPANGLSVKSGGGVKSILVRGSIITEGDGVVSYENEGAVEDFRIEGEIVARGEGSKPRMEYTEVR